MIDEVRLRRKCWLCSLFSKTNSINWKVHVKLCWKAQDGWKWPCKTLLQTILHISASHHQPINIWCDITYQKERNNLVDYFSPNLAQRLTKIWWWQNNAMLRKLEAINIAVSVRKGNIYIMLKIFLFQDKSILIKLPNLTPCKANKFKTSTCSHGLYSTNILGPSRFCLRLFKKDRPV